MTVGNRVSIRVATLAVIALACAPGQTRLAKIEAAPATALYAWAASADTSRRGAFLAVFDLRGGSPTAGRIVGAVSAGLGGRGTHHSEHHLGDDGLLFADDFGLGRTSIFDLTNAFAPRLGASFTSAGPLGWPHSYVRLPSGNRLVTYQFQSSKFNLPPGGIAEVRADGTIIRWASARTEGVDDKELTPYSLEVIPSLDRVVTTTTSMIEDTGVGVQIWRLSDFKLLHTLRIPGGPPHGMMHDTDTAQRHLFPGEPRVLRDGKTVMLATFTCGLYTVTGVDTDAPRVQPVYTFPGKDCAVPVVIGDYWVQTVPELHAVVALDVSNPFAPREVSRVGLGTGSRPHWLASDATGRRLVANDGSRRGTELYLLRFDPATGTLTRDAAFPVLDMARVSVPGIGEVQGVPHGAVFSR
ncbi:MAG: hypothetical protein WKF55_06660 [Gemmatimonadaceae bacterium]